uniref:Beclin-1 n=1 Tax=Caenorhabditis tropicalis TaxID=1561998 RepID=A0A1I7V3V9_9PELO
MENSLNRRRSFEAFADLDTLIAEMNLNVTNMTQAMNFDIGNSVSSESSIEQSVGLSISFETIQPMMEEMIQKVQEGLEIFHAPDVPSSTLLFETAVKLEELGDRRLSYRIGTHSSVLENATWKTMQELFAVYPLTDLVWMSVLRELQAQAAMPEFPRHLSVENCYGVNGFFGSYCFAENFLFKLPVNVATKQLNSADNANLEASDTDDE